MDRIVAALERARRGGSFGTAWLGRSTAEHAAEPLLSDAAEQHAIPLKVSREFTAHLAEQRVITPAHPNGAIDAYRVLRTQVLARMRPNHHTTLAVTSPGAGEGKSLTAANLAVSIAMEPQNTVLLVDCDLRQPRLHELFGAPAQPGLAEYLAQATPLARLIVRPPIERLALLPAGHAPANAPELLGSQRMQQLLHTLKAQALARYVVLDLPGVLHYADALALAPLADAVLLVVEERKTRTEDLLKTTELLSQTNLIGTVLNKSAHAGTGPRRAQAG